jgi:hypothetical protein
MLAKHARAGEGSTTESRPAKKSRGRPPAKRCGACRTCKCPKLRAKKKCLGVTPGTVDEVRCQHSTSLCHARQVPCPSPAQQACVRGRRLSSCTLQSSTEYSQGRSEPFNCKKNPAQARTLPPKCLLRGGRDFLSTNLPSPQPTSSSKA